MTRKFTESKLIIASHNAGKLGEIAALLAPFPIEIITAKSLDLPEPDESGKTYLENALIKARACSVLTNLVTLGDDSGIEVEALNGLPGLDTSPYTKAHGGRDEVFKLWQANAAIKNNPKAKFICVQVLLWPDGHYEHFFGEVKGRLTFPARGIGGHGYDPVFIPEGYEETVSEMSFEEKNACSHRFLAMHTLIKNCIL